MEYFTLDNVLSSRYCDEKLGWIDEEFTLTDRQKDVFVTLFGYGCSQKRKQALRQFIENPSGRSRGGYERVLFYPDNNTTQDGCDYIVNQSDTEISAIRKLICGW